MKVTYWAVDYALSYQHVVRANTIASWWVGASFRIGGEDKGFYDADVIGASDDVSVSKSNPETYLNVEFFQQRREQSGLFLALGARYRNVYAYDPEEDQDRMQLSLNLIGGYRIFKQRQPSTSKADLYLRYYNGVNPHGQLRNDKDFWLVALGVRLRM